MKNKVLLVFLAMVLVVSLAAFAGCAAPEEEEEAPPVKEEAPPVKEEAPPVKEVKYGGILRMLQTMDPPGWDSQRALRLSPYFTQLVFNNLVCFDITKPVPSPETIVPDLAERWEVSADGLTYTFFLYKGVKWHDGTPFTADDIVYNFEKIADPERSAIGRTFPAFKSAEKVDDYTVKVHLSQPQPSFLMMLGSGYALMLPKHLADVDFHSTDFLIGTGPFMFKSAVSGVEYVFERNPDYHKKDEAGNQLPYLDGVHFAIVADAAAATDAFITNKIDSLSITGGLVLQETIDRYKKDVPEAVYTMNPRGSHCQVVEINHKRPPLDDIRVRQALALIADMESMATAGFGDASFRYREWAIFPDPYSIGKAEFDKILGWDKPYEERVTEAKQLMEEAGYAEGFKLKIACQPIAQVTSMSEVYGDLLTRHLGLEVEIAPLSFADLAKAFIVGDYGLLLHGLPATTGDPDEVVGCFNTGSPSNHIGYSNATVDKLIAEQSKEMNLAKRVEICQEIERILLSDVAIIPQGAMSFGSAWYPYVKGIVRHTTYYTSHLRLERCWLDK